ncbi:hypothetical protein AB0K18_44425 [Nonomuraea sp. NPDC049421]|uniref:hypothetical protein n=1 Tax=Nonomuraea sp. NPDC049421 TaxID=3155275 RepID=UPI003435942B
MSTMTYPYQGEYAEGLLAEGKVQDRAEAVLEVLEIRGLVVPEWVRGRITSCRDLDILREWHFRAITVESAEDVFG